MVGNDLKYIRGEDRVLQGSFIPQHFLKIKVLDLCKRMDSLAVGVIPDP